MIPKRPSRAITKTVREGWSEKHQLFSSTPCRRGQIPTSLFCRSWRITAFLELGVSGSLGGIRDFPRFSRSALRLAGKDRLVEHVAAFPDIFVPVITGPAVRGRRGLWEPPPPPPRGGAPPRRGPAALRPPP